ncbi:MAG: flagellar basal body rod protein FlgB [Ignavibacterium sp.]|nr:flagellar basal body rod protein FlgB [Ignavibacterium sp.]MDW8374116.1 flagellar basal body rod protein FlgB [Ignavibacteriales bacterium]
MSISTIKLLEKFIDFCAERNKVISNNIANIGTENYRRQEISFDKVLGEELNSKIKTTRERHIKFNMIEDDPYSVQSEKIKEYTSGVNNVDIEKEMADLAENTLLFKFTSKKIGDYYRGIQNVIKGGGRV